MMTGIRRLGKTSSYRIGIDLGDVIGKQIQMFQGKKFNKKKQILLTWVIGAMFATVGFQIWFKIIAPSSEDYIEAVVNSYKCKEFNGTIIDKYIDEENSNFKKIIFENNKDAEVILFGYEVRKVYEFLMIGDIIQKEKGSLFMSVSRSNLDTIIEFQFLDARGIEIPFIEEDKGQCHGSD
ncbi:hypothetical protein EYV94_22750 [Puteibacter caeruleilacunae]|nr:hypothetical protein EYV94_22750 [Puteibacter caeruleilacunae]